MAYSEKVLEHYNNPKNVGTLDKAKHNVGTGLVGAPECGDVMRLTPKACGSPKSRCNPTKRASSDSPDCADGSSPSRPLPLILSVLRHAHEWRFIYGRVP